MARNGNEFIRGISFSRFFGASSPDDLINSRTGLETTLVFNLSNYLFLGTARHPLLPFIVRLRPEQWQFLIPSVPQFYKNDSVGNLRTLTSSTNQRRQWLLGHQSGMSVCLSPCLSVCSHGNYSIIRVRDNSSR